MEPTLSSPSRRWCGRVHKRAANSGRIERPFSPSCAGAEEVEDDDEPFEEKMKRLTATLREQMAEVRKLDAAIEANLRELGHGH